MKKGKGINLSMNDAKLAKKLSVIIGILIAVIFLIMNSISLFGSSKYLGDAVEREFLGICRENSLKLTNMVDVCSNIANGIDINLQTMYASENTGFSGQNSRVNGAPLTTAQYESEIIIINAIRSAVQENDSIIGAGVLFEPGAFDADGPLYCPYVTKDDAQKGTFTDVTYDTYKDKAYYIDAREKESLNFSSVYVGHDGVPVFSISYPIVSNGEFKGVVLLDITNDIFSILDAQSQGFKNLRVNLTDENNDIMYESDTAEETGMNMKELMDEDMYNDLMARFEKGESFTTETGSSKGKTIRFYTPISVAEGEDWWLQCALPASEYNHAMVLLGGIMIAVCIVFFIVLIAAIIVTVRRMLKPIDTVVDAALKIERGDLDVHLEVRTKDEVGMLSEAFNGMAANLKHIISDMDQALGKMAKGNFQIKSQCPELYIGAYETILLSIRLIERSLSDTLREISQASSQVNVGAEQVSAASQGLSQGATQQASSVEELSATMTEITEKIKYNAEKAQQASALSNEAGAEVSVSNQKMVQLTAAMDDITNKSNEIGKIVKTIDDIAFQTNILALNAAVEAARAGAAGKGFAVVADEVRNLAQKSAEAAKNTTALIESTVQAVANGAQITSDTEASLLRVVESVSQVNVLIEEISGASQEQSQGVAQVTLGIDQISSVVQTNSATAEQSAAASQELSGQSSMLDELVSRFQLAEDDNSTAGASYDFESRSPQIEPEEVTDEPIIRYQPQYPAEGPVSEPEPQQMQEPPTIGQSFSSFDSKY